MCASGLDTHTLQKHPAPLAKAPAARYPSAMASKSSGRYNTFAGAFLLGSILLAVAVSFVIGGGISLTPKTSFYVRFPISSGATGLKPGSSVALGGQQVGVVTDVSFAPPPGVAATAALGSGVDSGSAKAAAGSAPKAGTEVPAEPCIYVRVKVSLPYPLAENAGVHLELPLLGSLSRINISSLGNVAGVIGAQNGSAYIDENDIITGGSAPPGFLAQAGFGPDQIQQLQTIISDVQVAIQQIRASVQTNSPKIDAAVDDATSVIADVRTRYPAWATSIDNSTKSVETAAAMFPDITTKASARVDQAGEVLTDAQTAIKRVDGIIADNRGKIDEIVEGTRQTVAMARDESLPAFNKATKTFEDTLTPYRELGHDAQAFFATQIPELRRTVANLRLTSDQLKLTVAEIRTQPWRLFFQPGMKELEADILYRATALYADAVGNLRSASESLENAATLGTPNNPGSPLDANEVLKLSEALRESMQKYKEAEKNLMDVLIKQSK